MRPRPRCPRCGGQLRAPGLWSSEWTCVLHGAVAPYAAYHRVTREGLDQVVADARVPVWIPRPVPAGWLVTGFGSAGDERTGGRATVLALSGPAPLGGPADLLLVAEEPGVGLGARYAGMPGPDPGPVPADTPPQAKLEAAGHPTPLWSEPTPADCAAYVGEAKGCWLWALLYPAGAGLLLVENIVLVDLREQAEPDLGFGALTPRLGVEPAP